MKLPVHESLYDKDIIKISKMSYKDFNTQIKLERTKGKIKELTQFEMKDMSQYDLEIQVHIENSFAKEGCCDLCGRGIYVFFKFWDEEKLWLCDTCKKDLEK